MYRRSFKKNRNFSTRINNKKWKYFSKKKKNRIKFNRIHDFSDCSLFSWNNWKSFPKWNTIYQSRMKRKRHEEITEETLLPTWKISKQFTDIKESFITARTMVFFFYFDHDINFSLPTSVISTPLISPPLLLLFSTWDINPAQIFNF